MEKWGRKHILENLPKLIEITECNVTLLSILRADGILSSEEVNILQNQNLDDFQKSQKFYQILETRRDGFKSLKQALFKCQQTGAYDILNQVNEIVASLGGEFKNCGSISYDRKTLLGKGCFNTKVFKGRVGSRDVAVKQISREDIDEKKALEEVSRLKELDWHENIVRYFNTEITDDHILIALELCSIDLDEWVKSKCISIDRIEILRQATKGILHLHRHKVIHRDVKPANILIVELSCGETKVKISDFGISKKVHDGRSCITLHSNTFGTMGWVAPEMAKALDSESVSDAVIKMYFSTDVFALGCVFYFVLTDGQHPFGKPHRREANISDYAYSLNAAHLQCPENGAFSLIREMIKENPKQRLPSSEILLHHFFWPNSKALRFLSDIRSVLNADIDGFESHFTLFRDHGDYQSWLVKVSEPVKAFLLEKASCGENTIDLVESIMFLENNYHTLPKDVQKELGAPPEEFGKYWFSRFDALVPMTWLHFQILRHQYILEKYYPKEYDFENHYALEMSAYFSPAQQRYYQNILTDSECTESMNQTESDNIVLTRENYLSLLAEIENSGKKRTLQTKETNSETLLSLPDYLVQQETSAKTKEKNRGILRFFRFSFRKKSKREPFFEDAKNFDMKTKEKNTGKLRFPYFSIKLKKDRFLTVKELNAFMNGIHDDAESVNADYVFAEHADHSSFPHHFQIAKEDIKRGDIIGTGQFGLVFRGKLLSNFKEIDVAVKVPRALEDKQQFKNALSEVKIYSYVGKHKNIVSFLGAYLEELSKGKLFIVLEYCENGSLLGYLRRMQRNPDSGDEKLGDDEYKLYKFSCEIASGMEYIAEKNVIHGDLAARNILLTSEHTCKISDFGLSRRLYDYTKYVKSTKEALPWRWMAPESLKMMTFTTKSDVWSYGITLWEIFSLGNLPYAGILWNLDYVTELEKGMRLEKPQYATDNIYKWLLKCWHNDPDQRPNFGDLTKYFTDLRETQ